MEGACRARHSNLGTRWLPLGGNPDHPAHTSERPTVRGGDTLSRSGSLWDQQTRCVLPETEKMDLYTTNIQTHTYIYVLWMLEYTCSFAFHILVQRVSGGIISQWTLCKFPSFPQWHSGDLSTSVYTDLLQSFQLLHSNSSIWVRCHLNIL